MTVADHDHIEATCLGCGEVLTFTGLAVGDPYVGRIEAFDAVLAYLNDIRGNGYDDPRDPALDAVWDKVTDLRKRNAAAHRVAAER